MRKIILPLFVILSVILFCCTNDKMLQNKKTGTDDSVEYVNLVSDSADNSKLHSGNGIAGTCSVSENAPKQ